MGSTCPKPESLTSICTKPESIIVIDPTPKNEIQDLETEPKAMRFPMQEGKLNITLA